MPHQLVEIFVAETVLHGHETAAMMVLRLIIVMLVCSHLISIVVANLLGNSGVNADQLQERRSVFSVVSRMRRTSLSTANLAISPTRIVFRHDSQQSSLNL